MLIVLINLLEIINKVIFIIIVLLAAGCQIPERFFNYVVVVDKFLCSALIKRSIKNVTRKITKYVKETRTKAT